MALSRRAFLWSAGTAAAAAACAPAAAPTGTAQTGPTGPKAEWEKQWDELIAAAKNEGRVVVQTAAGAGYREALEEFPKAFPAVELDHQQFPEAATYVPKITNERRAGIYTLDVAILPPTSALLQLKPIGAFESLRPILFRPDVLDDKVWDGGFEGRWRDVEKKLAFSHMRDVNKSVWINTDLVKESEITKVEDLLDPKWKGKIVIADPRQGAFYIPMSVLKLNGKEDVIKRLLVDQDPQVIRDRRQHPESIIRGRYPIGIGVLRAAFNEYLNQGVGKNVKNIDLPEMDFQPSDCVFLYNKAPHPNAAKLFINWFLTKESGVTWSTNVKVNFARLDVPVAAPDNMPKEGVVYKHHNQEEIYDIVAEVQKLVGELAKT